MKTSANTLGWLGIFRLGLVQTALGLNGGTDHVNT